MKRLAMLMAAWCLLLAGCGPAGESTTSPTGSGERLDPLPVAQMKAYPEAAGGLFVSLADFEDTATLKGYAQAEWFSITPPAGDAGQQFTVNITRTGAGALAASLPAGGQLVFSIPAFRDFSGYTLLSLAVYSQTLRDDLCVTLTTAGVTWTSPRTLIAPGWNTVEIDIQRLRLVEGFDQTAVSGISLQFADAGGPVSFVLDDVLLIDNTRTLEPTPPGMSLSKSGLDYAISLPGQARPVVLAQGGDGLWRLGDMQATVQAVGPGQPLPAEGEHLELMGGRTIGRVDVLEVNPVRVRLASTWYFPTRAGEWLSLGMPRIAWEYTFYDGRWVTGVEISNPAGLRIGALRMWVNKDAAWSNGVISRDLVIRDFQAALGRWSFLQNCAGPLAAVAADYLQPGRVEATLAGEAAFADGDADRDGFDESQGCYFIQAAGGQCRFTLHPPRGGLSSPVFRIAGEWSGAIRAACDGLAIRDVVRLEDGSALFVVPGRIERPVAIEVTAGR